MVREMEMFGHGCAINGTVEGDGHTLHSVYIEMNASGIDGDCSCPVAYNCEHVSALLLALLDTQSNESSDPGTHAIAPQSRRTPDPAETNVQTTSSEYPADVHQRILYVLHPALQRSHLHVEVVAARKMKDGSYGKISPYLLRNFFNHTLHRFVLPIDVDLIRHVKPSDMNSNSFTPVDIQGATLMKRMLQTGRCHWLDARPAPLAPGKERPGTWFWHVSERAVQQLCLRIPDGKSDDGMAPASFIIPSSPPFYLSEDGTRCGPIATDCPDHLYESLFFVGAFGPEKRSPWTDLPFDWPASVPEFSPLHFRHVDIAPKPVLKLLIDASNPYLNGVQLSFDYGGFRRDSDIRPINETVYYQQQGQWFETHDDRDVEQAFIRQLRSVGLRRLNPHRSTMGQPPENIPEWILPSKMDWPEFLACRLEPLREAGFLIETPSGFRYEIVRVRQWDVHCKERGIMGEIHFEVVLNDGLRLDLIDIVADWVNAAPKRLSDASLREMTRQTTQHLSLPDGRILPIAASLLHGILTAMLDLFAGKKVANDRNIAAMHWLQLRERLKFTPNTHVREHGDWVDRMHRLADMREIPSIPPPAGLTIRLRDYQQHGLSWLQCLLRLNTEALLADDMGLGKTVQTLAHILKEKEVGNLCDPALVVMPTSLMHNWKAEAARFAPGLRVLTWHGSDRGKSLGIIKDHDLVLTTYGLMVRDIRTLQARHWSMLVLDEAQHIRNPRTSVARMARELKTGQRICLTGTPMENHLGDLWALFDFLMPGYLRDTRTFTRIFRQPIEQEGGGMRQQQLNLRIRPFILRRTKEDVAAELPPKTTMIHSVDMGEAQRELYEGIRLMMHKKVRDAMRSMGRGQSHIIMLEALLKMRQACCDPRLLKHSLLKNGETTQQHITLKFIDRTGSAKLDWLRETLPEMIAEGRRVLLFSQFTRMLKFIAAACDEMTIPYVTLTGASRHRGAIVEAFQNHEAPLFLISLKAGGAGLNLTAADTVIHYDPWWNPAAEMQASDRAHRIGQNKPVFIYKLIAAGSVESRILDMQARKQKRADALYAGAKQSTPLWSGEELITLFAPLQE